MVEYFSCAFAPEARQKVLDDAVQALEGHEFGAIAVRGMSGAIMGSVIAHALQRPLILVRKEGNSTHSNSRLYTGEYGPRPFLIVDDLISTGRTTAITISILSRTRPISCAVS